MSYTLDELKAKREKLKQEKLLREQDKIKKQQEGYNTQQPKPTPPALELIKKIIESKKAPSPRTLIAQNEEQKTEESHIPVIAEQIIPPQVVEIIVQPKKPQTYNREIQVDLIFPQNSQQQNEGSTNEELQGSRPELLQQVDEKSHKPPVVGLISAVRNKEDNQPDREKEKDNERKRKSTDEGEVVVLSKDEAKAVMKQKDFENFISRASRIIERALNTEADVIGAFFDNDDEEQSKSSNMVKGEKITQMFTFQDDVFLKRAITSIEWSPKVNELLLCSYSKCNEWKVDEPDGYINIFSQSLRKRPEMTLTSQYEITKAIFNPFQPNIVMAATYSGFILQWDIRAKTTPVQKSCLAKNGHNHPIYCLAIVGSANAHNIVSISNDGKLCFWSQGMLNEPKMTMNLTTACQSAQSAQSENQSINVHCMDFPEDETDKFYIGAEDYNIYQGNLHSGQQQSVLQTYTGHVAPVTRVHMHPGTSQSDKNADISDLMLSSSMDWTIKLWYPKIKNECLFTFESSQEYVYDVQWSTVHPSVFASCDGEGYIDIWDINRDTEAPVARKKTGSRALNCLKWSLDGRRIACGDSEGFVSLWSVDKEYGMQKNEDFTKLERLVSSNQGQPSQKIKT